MSRTTALHSILAENHISLSFPDSSLTKVAPIVLNESYVPKQSKTVFVIGAGASFDSAKIPLAASAADSLTSKLSRVNGELLKFEISRLENVYRLSGTDFETKLLALSKFDPITLVDELHKIFNRRYCPTITYEIISHLLKHRFVDAVINFNFDELLDQSIEDEIGNLSLIHI